MLKALVHELTHADLTSIIPEDMSFETSLQARIDRLAPGDRAALDLVAVAGAPLPVALLARALGDPSDIHARLARLHAARLVHLGRRNHAPSVEVLHARARVLVVDMVGPVPAAGLHRLLADTAVKVGRPDAEFMARHLFAAGDRERAAFYAERAGKVAAESLAFVRAAELYELALRCTPEVWPRMVACARAKVEAGLGREAAPIYLRAAERAPPSHRAELRVRACEQYFAVGETARGEDVLTDLLQGTGFPDPGGGEALAAAFQAEVAGLLRPPEDMSQETLPPDTPSATPCGPPPRASTSTARCARPTSPPAAPPSPAATRPASCAASCSCAPCSRSPASRSCSPACAPSSTPTCAGATTRTSSASRPS